VISYAGSNLADSSHRPPQMQGAGRAAGGIYVAEEPTHKFANGRRPAALGAFVHCERPYCLAPTLACFVSPRATVASCFSVHPA